jgi:hypothetical protein
MTRLRSTSWLGDRKRRRALTASLVVALVAVGTAAAVTTRATVAPSSNSLPTITGSATTGGTLNANPGTWSGSAPITFQYQWRICDGNGNACHNIAGATSQSYVLTRDDAGNTTRVTVIASNGDGSASATSGPSAKIAVAAAGPANTAAPSIGGTAVTGGTLTASPGSWNPAAASYAYQWTICDGNGNACHDIAGATANTYTLKRDDAGNTVRVRVTARAGNGGTTSVTSTPSARIAVAGSTPAPNPNPGCPTPAAGTQSVPIANVAAPTRLQIAQFQVVTGQLNRSTRSFSARFQVTDTCGHPVSGALVYPAAVPYNQFSAGEAPTDTAGWVTMTFNRRAGFPASPKQQQLTMFVRARKAGESILGGVSTRRLISFSIAR